MPCKGTLVMKQFLGKIGDFFKRIGHYFKTMNKDKFIDLLVTIGNIIIWTLPITVVVYVLTWFFTK